MASNADITELWCEELIELRDGPTQDVTARHMCWNEDGEGHDGEHACRCGFRWSTEEVPC